MNTPRRALATSLLVLASCTASAPQAPQAPPAPAPPAAASSPAAAPAPAAVPAAQPNVDDAVRVVQALYDEAAKYFAAQPGAEVPSPAPLWERPAILSAGLATAFKNADSAFGVLDWDPVVDGQDARLSDIVVRGAPAGEGALVTATFKNFGEPKEVRWHFVREGDAYKLDNVTTAAWDVRKHLARP